MHPFLFMTIHHALVVAIVAFFVLFAASKADGFVKLLGNVLGYLLLICAVLLVVWVFVAPVMGWHPLPMHPGMMHGWGQAAPPPGQAPVQ
jgi:antibiotic biosynthesis monooxygenase (ABM) superfamily enzyme